MPSFRLARAVHAALLPFAATVPLAHAQSPASAPLDEVVVTATRLPETVDNLIADVTVIDVTPGAPGLSLADLLRSRAGAQLSNNGGPAGTTGFFLRGANTGHSLLLVDGFRMSSSSLGQTTWEALPIDYARRIEVLEGPASALYGADAIGGVVQLLGGPLQTGLRGDVSAAIGQQSTRQLRGGLEGGDDRIRGRIRLGKDRSDGYDATTANFFDANPDRDGYRRDSVSAQLEARLSANTQLRATALQTRLENHYDNGPFDGARVKTRTDLIGLSASHVVDAATTVEARVGRSRDRSENISSFPGTFETTQMQYGVSGTRVLMPGIAAKLLLERLEEEVEAQAYAGTQSKRTTNSVGLILSGSEGPHRLQASARLDDSNQYGNETHFSLAYGYSLGHGLRVGASAATAFHAPGFNDLYFPGYGRSAIRPETARNTELGLWWNPAATGAAGNASRWHGKVVAFQSRVKDLIVYAPVCPDPDPMFAFGCADNVERARIRGLTLAIGQQQGAAAAAGAARDQALETDRASGLAWTVNLDLLNPRNTSQDRQLARRARQQLTAVVDYGSGPWRVGADVVMAGDRFDDAANLQRLGGYTVINLRAAWRLGRDLEAFGSVTNVGDRDYVTAHNYRTQGRLAMVGLRYAMR